jgi:hypothetical protein
LKLPPLLVVLLLALVPVLLPPLTGEPLPPA